jgi:hypothetical protein
MAKIRFLIVDCILDADESLAELVSHLKDDLFVLWDREEDGHHSVGFETNGFGREFEDDEDNSPDPATNILDTTGPYDDISKFLDSFEALPPELLQALRSCKKKIFDIAFECGRQEPVLDAGLGPSIITRISQLGFGINIRLYPASWAERPPSRPDIA